MVLVLLGPANQDRPVAVEPGAACLDDPATCSPIGVAPLEIDLLAAGTDVWCEFAGLEQVADDREVIGLVQAEALGVCLGRLGAVDRDRVERLLQ